MKELIVIGDRVLIQLDNTEERTEVGLYLPQTVKDREEVFRGRIIKTGPGLPLADPTTMGEEPWSNRSTGRRYLPMEARPGDYALFLRKAAVEISYEGENYYIVPQSALLLLVRDQEKTTDEEIDLPPLDFE